MSSFPSGTVTFLFTDIEGSTKLARTYPETWEAARAHHQAILRDAIESNNGYIFQIIGDAFCATFHKSTSALKAATQAQQRLKNETWVDAEIRVRMGIHTGEGELLEDGQYQGYLALSLVQRIMSAGHGGQVLLSGATENLLRGQLPESVDLLDMGRHNFKDVPQAVRVFQVNADDLQRDFPPLRTFDILPTNLPAQLTSFVGREKELADVKRLLADAHMLNLIGPGGTGKTRLSIQAANDVLNQYPDGVWLVDLAPILDPLLVPRTTAITIGLRNEPQRPVIDMLCDYLAKKKMLLILDNCEHLVDACAQLSDRILRAAPDVRILASSREALGIAGEVTYRVPSLGMPDVDNLPSLESMNQYEAVKLFIDRATAAIPAFKVTNENAPALAQICHRLDGIPLAIELAAAKIRVLGVEQIAKRLDNRFKLLTGGSRTAMERHQTLRATVDWSYNLLPPEEQLLFKRLSVFLGGWTLEAAESICGDDVLDLLEQLINKSLVVSDDKDGTSRYRLLETIRQYANEKLVESSESDDLRDKHLEYFLNLAKTAEPHLYRNEQLEWLAQLDADYENVRSALEWSLNNNSTESSLHLCISLNMYWSIRGYMLEGLGWCKRALARLEQTAEAVDKAIIAKALYTRAEFEWATGNYEQLLVFAQKSLSLASAYSDRRDIAIAKFYVGVGLMTHTGENDQAHSLYEQCVAEFNDLNEIFWEAVSFPFLGYLLARQGKYNQYNIVTRYLELARQSGERLILAAALQNYAYWLACNNQMHEAQEFAEESIQVYKQIGVETTSSRSGLIADIAWSNGDYEKAISIYTEMHESYRVSGEKMRRAQCLEHLGCLAMDGGDLDQSKTLLDEALGLFQEIGHKFYLSRCLVVLSYLFYLRGNLTKFKDKFRECLSSRNSLDETYKTYILMTVLGSLHIQKPEVSARLLGVIDNCRNKDYFIFLPMEQRYCRHAEVHVRKTLGDATFDLAFAEGQKLSLDDGLDLALNAVEEM